METIAARRSKTEDEAMTKIDTLPKDNKEIIKNSLKMLKI
jgi:hypothetical protein